MKSVNCIEGKGAFNRHQPSDTCPLTLKPNPVSVLYMTTTRGPAQLEDICELNLNLNASNGCQISGGLSMMSLSSLLTGVDALNVM